MHDLLTTLQLIMNFIVSILNNCLGRLDGLLSSTGNLILDSLRSFCRRLNDRLGRIFLLLLRGFSLVLALVGIDLVGTVLLYEGDEVFDSARAGVSDRLQFLAGREEFDGWEALDLIWNIVGGSVNLGDRNAFRVFYVGEIEIGELFVLRGKAGWSC